MSVNVNRSVLDQFYRYKMPRIIAKVSTGCGCLESVIPLIFRIWGSGSDPRPVVMGNLYLEQCGGHHEGLFSVQSSTSVGGLRDVPMVTELHSLVSSSLSTEMH